MSPINLSRRCFAPSCKNEHSVLQENIEESGKVIWVVTAKTFFKIAHCYILAGRYLMCLCIIMKSVIIANVLGLVSMLPVTLTIKIAIKKKLFQNLKLNLTRMSVRFLLKFLKQKK